MASITINGTVYTGDLKGPWPENPQRKFQRQGGTQTCIPGIDGGNVVAGHKIRVDNGFHETWDGASIILPYVPEVDLIAILSHARTTTRTTVTYQDPTGNQWECVYDPGNPVVFVPYAGFPDRSADGPGVEAYTALYRVVINLLFVSKTVSGPSIP
jgi:hypothetical protein